MALSTAWERVATGQRVVTACVSVVATCRQTVEVFPRAVHRLGAGGYGLRLGGSHLSPAGGGLSRAAVHRLGAGGYGAAVGYGLRVGGSHLSPDGGGLSRAAVHRLGAGGYGAAGGYGFATRW